MVQPLHIHIKTMKPPSANQTLNPPKNIPKRSSKTKLGPNFLVDLSTQEGIGHLLQHRRYIQKPFVGESQIIALETPTLPQTLKTDSRRS
jgi:hypothetical protein